MAKGKKIFGKKIRKRRDELFKTQVTVAEEAEISPRHYKRIESKDVTAVGVEKIPRLAIALKVDLEKFVAEFVVPIGWIPEMKIGQEDATGNKPLKRAAKKLAKGKDGVNL